MASHLFLLACLFDVASATDPTFMVDKSYGLAITVSGVPADVACTITWSRTDGVGPGVSQKFEANAPIKLLRFTPRKEYRFAVKDSSGKPIGSKSHYACTAGETGDAELDADAPLVTFTGRPTFEMLVVDRASSLVGINAHGWVVWYLPNGNGAWDQLPKEFNYDIVTLSGFGTLDSSGILEYTPSGQNVSKVLVDGLSHEARVDRVTNDVLSIGSEVKNISGLKNPISGSTIVKWDRKSRQAQTVYNLFDYYDPVTDYGQCSGRNDSSACRPPSAYTNVFPPGGGAEDWTHANSVERGTQNNYIMSVRHLSSVISFHADGSGIQWVMSGEGIKPSKAPDAKVLTYAAQGQQQYMEHCARQLKNGNVILFDNGDLRTPPFTRFSEYKIDVASGKASLVWQFLPMLDNATSGLPMFAFHAGSVERLANGNTVGALSCDNARVGVNCSHAVFEADSNGKEVARALIPAPPTGDFGYRGLPLETLGGEREETTDLVQIIV